MSNTQMQRDALDAAFKKHQHDIYVLNADELIQVWVAEQKSAGKNMQQIQAHFLALTETPLVKHLDHYGREFGGTAIAAGSDAKMLSALAIDMRRSGSMLGRYYVQTQGGKQYIVFKGRAGFRQVLTGTRYLANNTKVMSMGVGGQALKASAKGGLLISVIFSVSINSLTWLFNDEFRWTDWLATVTTDVVKGVVAGTAAYLTGAAIAGKAVAGTVAILPIAAGLFVAVTVAVGLYLIDQHFGITAALIQHLERKEESVKQDLSAGIYYVMSSTGQAVKRQFIRSVKAYLASLLRHAF
ncbi:hypothetical protein [Rheinheimera nanhaiensis]|uniref:Uncharacterized protein n=1 Tax=Rheinheimera nanhaiensis E407-8 TaxID=562729 RepID=I1E132_9GAMM|nr:hypothetical protein [Rheinheimera nanhaiensis]GAB60010.1 hypothetical protein RNAN_3023 [Rheinheimera nanhaiensis E407-8]